MKEQKRNKKLIFILIGQIVIALAGEGGFYKIKQYQKAKMYSQAEQCFQQKDYSASMDLFTQLGSYKDVSTQVQPILYDYAYDVNDKKLVVDRDCIYALTGGFLVPSITGSLPK